MVTKLLFREDPYMIEFSAKVTGIDCNKIILDQTCFFPQGGGQVGDAGEINGLRVIDTKKDEHLNVIHILESSLSFKLGDIVHGRIDWDKRYKIMRLHSAAHVVYYVMRQVFGEKCKPASSGLVDDKKDRSDYLFDEKLNKEKLGQVEKRANEVIADEYDVMIWVDEKNPDHKYWKIEPFEAMSCGGTHVKNTREIGRILVKRGNKPGSGKERIEVSLT